MRDSNPRSPGRNYDHSLYIQIIKDNNLPITVIVNEHVAEFPTASVKTYSTVVTPAPNVSSGLWVCTKVTGLLVSVAVGSVHQTAISVTPVGGTRVVSSGQLIMLGGVMSTPPVD